MKKFERILSYFVMTMIAVFLFLDVRVQDVKAATYTSGSWQYNINGGYVEIAGYTGSLSNVTIPDSLNGYTVKYIANYAFADNYSLKTVTIPKNIKSIGSYAFKNCAYLTTVNYNAIECTSMYGYDVFKGCDNFTTLKIGDNVESLPNYAFDSTNITSVTIPNKIKEIPYSCFASCTKLASVTLNSSIKKIDDYAFNNNYSLKTITIPENIKSIGDYAFKNCAYLTTVNYNAIECTSMYGYNVFKGCDNFTTLKIGDNVESLPSYAFDSTNITKVTIPNKIKEIPYSCFASCTKLASVTLNSSIKKIDDCAFNNNYSLKTITIPENIKSIGDYAFKNCANLTTVNYNAIECTSMYGYNVFSGCDNFTTLKLGNNVESLPSYAFDSTNITKVTIPNKVQEIPYSCFKNCKKLTNVTLGSSIKKIGSYAFYNNSSLKSITIPSTVETIESYAFKDCAYLVTGGFVIYGKKGSYAETYANSNSITFKEATNKNLLISSFIADKESPQVVGTSITLTARATGEGTLQYRFRVGIANGNSSVIKDYSTSNIATWKANYAGTKVLYVDVKDSTGKVVTKTMNYVVKDKPVALKISSFTTSKASPQVAGTEIGLTVKATGTGTLKYRFRVGTANGNSSVIKDYSTSNTAIWKANYAGTKILYVDVKDSTGKVLTKTMSYIVKDKPVALKISSFTTSKASPQVAGTSITLTAKAAGTGTLKYRFRVGTANGNSSVIKDYSTSNTAIWKANYVGTKILYVDVKDSTGKVATKTIKYIIK